AYTYTIRSSPRQQQYAIYTSLVNSYLQNRSQQFRLLGKLSSSLIVSPGCLRDLSLGHYSLLSTLHIYIVIFIIVKSICTLTLLNYTKLTMYIVQSKKLIDSYNL
ncbi:unnamed protein product, partial [Acanthoscelides obtectus]